ncbi:class I SAM-dependent methyltransferase [Candidatus Roizmanbacteria bacterium]|nr:class I SAM-dependent methyltransferase [Candidatus Roizmanbacteria bacterium]
MWHSSYEKNNYGDLFYSLIRLYKPKTVVELGTKAGYSAYHIARALRENGKGHLYCYDLWGKYPYHSAPQSVAEKNLQPFKETVTLKLLDAVGVDTLHTFVDVLHVDVSNEGGILNRIIPKWIRKVRQFIVIEGGSKERDHVPWMSTYHKKPIQRWLKDFSSQHGDIEYLTIEPFPSVTIIRKKL